MSVFENDDLENDDDFKMEVFHFDMTSRVREFYESFSEIIDLFQEQLEADEVTANQLSFYGSGLNSFGAMISGLLADIEPILNSAQDRLNSTERELERQKKSLRTFEKEVLNGLDKLLITDAHDVR